MMKCKIVQNEGIPIFLLVFIAVINCVFVPETSQTIQELCSSNRYIYSVKTGETYHLKLTSANSSREVSKWIQKSKHKCRKEFKTNNGASHFVIIISNMSVPSCSEKCQCNYFELAEPGYSRRYCGENKEAVYFESKSDYLSIDFQHGSTMRFNVTLTFTVQRNTYMITGVPRDDNLYSGSFLETPYFPNEHQANYLAEYILQADDIRGHVMLIFLDFQIASESFIEVVGHNGTHPGRFDGSIFRPPVLVSQQHQLNLRFEANNQPRSGFRAVCFFVKNIDFEIDVPYSNCGGVNVKYGGLISIEKNRKHIYYDCVWHLSPPVFVFLQGNSYTLSVSNISVENTGRRASLEFREGLSSKSKLVKSIDCWGSNCSQISVEITVPASSGLYVRFNGYLDSDSTLNMAYISYHSGNCSQKEVKCNDRCLFHTLRCDGIEQCPDGSDELECTTETVIKENVTPSSTISKRRLHSKNTVAAFFVVLSFGICGLIIVVLVVVFVSCRLFKTVPPATEQIVPTQVVSEMAGPIPRTCTSWVSSFCDQPPSYEDFIRSSDCYPPPLYTRAMKRNSEPFPSYHNAHHTTSFCGRDVFKHHSIHSFDLRSLNSTTTSDTDASPEPALFGEASCSFGRNNVELTVDNGHLKTTSRHDLKRAASLGSKLDRKGSGNDCQLHLSITHSICTHACQCSNAKYHSLPSKYTINDLNPHEIDITFQTAVPNMQCFEKQHFASCVFGHDSVNVKSEILTTVKTRCYSDP